MIYDKVDLQIDTTIYLDFKAKDNQTGIYDLGWAHGWSDILPQFENDEQYMLGYSAGTNDG